MRSVVLVVCVVIAGCYAPSYDTPCTVRCGTGGTCPGGFSCLQDNYCHGHATEQLCPCQPLRCEELPGACGDMPDTCGGTTHCGDTCTKPDTCGGAGTPNVCGDPGKCVPQACPTDACGPYIDSCGNPTTCPNCPQGMKCTMGKCVACTPHCATGDLKCGDDSCGGSCGNCPDARWTCHEPEGLCCIKENEHCQPLLEGCNCCPGLFCVNGICQPDTGCAMAPTLTPSMTSDGSESLDQLVPLP